MSNLASLFNVIPVGLIAFLILLGALGFWLRWNPKISQITNELSALRQQLLQRQEDGVDALYDIHETIKDPSIKALFEETQNSLFDMPSDLGSEKYSLKTYQEIWQPKALLAKRVNISMFEAMPNILIGVGLMFTFLYLAFALNSASNALGASGTDAMKPLLENAGGKFWTSIAGIFCSLVWNIMSKRTLEALDDEIEALSIAFRRIAKDTGAEAAVSLQMILLSELLNESREQVGQLKRFETDFAVAIAKAMGDTLKPAFDGLGSELSAAINNLSQNLAKMNQEALSDMLKQFVDQMGVMQNKEMQQFMAALGGLAEKLENAVPTMAAAADEAGKNMANAMQSAVERLSDAFGDCMDDLQEAAKALEASLLLTKGNVVDLSNTIERAREVGDAGVSRADAVISKLGDSVQGMEATMRSVSEVVGAVEAASGKLANLGDNLSESVESQRAVVRIVQDVVPRLHQDIQKAFMEINNASKQAEKAMAEAQRHLGGTTDRLDKTLSGLNEGIDNYSTRLRDLHTQLDNHLGQAVTKLDGTMNNLSETLDEFIENLPSKQGR